MELSSVGVQRGFTTEKKHQGKNKIKTFNSGISLKQSCRESQQEQVHIHRHPTGALARWLYYSTSFLCDILWYVAVVVSKLLILSQEFALCANKIVFKEPLFYFDPSELLN